MEERTMGFFAWIREGVRRAVLMGFSDAVTQIGTRTQSDDLCPQLAVSFQNNMSDVDAGSAAPPKVSVASSAPRKRLGRSLDQLRETGKAA